MGSVAPVVWELWLIEVKKKGDFLPFLYFAWNCSDLGDIVTNEEVANLKINVKATYGQNLGSVALVVLEL